MLSRRTLLKTGLAGAALLGGAGLVGLIAGRDRGAERRDILSALAGALLDGALPTDPAAAATARTRCVSATGTAIDGLSPAAQDELAQLFTLLSIAPGRLLLAGLDRPWSQAAPADIRAAADGWRAGLKHCPSCAAQRRSLWTASPGIPCRCCLWARPRES